MSFENFVKWMELATDLSEKSIKNYLGGISKIDKDLLETSTSRKSLEAISSINELENSINKTEKDLDSLGTVNYLASEDFESLNERYENISSNVEELNLTKKAKGLLC